MVRNVLCCAGHENVFKKADVLLLFKLMTYGSLLTDQRSIYIHFGYHGANDKIMKWKVIAYPGACYREDFAFAKEKKNKYHTRHCL